MELMITADLPASGFDAARYFVSTACKHGNIWPRRISDRKCTCPQCSAEKTARSKARKAATYQRTKGKALESSRAWAAENKDLRRAYKQRRRARKLNATPPWAGELDDMVEQEAADLCQRRERATGYAWHIDHMIPLQARAACGLHCAANLQVIPARMNIAKGNSMKLIHPFEWVGVV